MAPWFSAGTTLPGLGLGLAGLQVGELPLGAEVSACFPLCLNPDPSVLLWHGGCPSPLAASLGLWACGGPWVSAHLMATGSLEVPLPPLFWSQHRGHPAPASRMASWTAPPSLPSPSLPTWETVSRLWLEPCSLAYGKGHSVEARVKRWSCRAGVREQRHGSWRCCHSLDPSFLV